MKGALDSNPSACKLQTLMLSLIGGLCCSFVRDAAAGPSSTASGEDAAEQTPYYINQIHAMREFELTTLYVDYKHLMESEQVLAKAIADQYYRFLPHLRLAIQDLVRKYERDYLYTNAHLSSSTSSGLQTREFSIAFYDLPIVSSHKPPAASASFLGLPG